MVSKHYPKNFGDLLKLVCQHVRPINDAHISFFLDGNVDALSVMDIVTSHRWLHEDIEMHRPMNADYYTPYLAARDLLIDKILDELLQRDREMTFTLR